MESQEHYTVETDDQPYGNARFSILQSRAVTDQRLSNSQFRTLAALAIFGDKDGWCWPSQTTLGKMLGKSRQAVSQDIQALIELDYIESHPRYRDDGSQTSNMYRLLFDLVVGVQADLAGGERSELAGGERSELAPINDSFNDSININADSPEIVAPKHEKSGHIDKEEYLRSIERATSRGIANQARKQSLALFKGVDITKYPVDVQDIIEEVCVLWNLRAPRSPKGSGGKLWITSARELKDACGEFGLDTLRALRAQFKEHMANHNGLAPFRVNSPQSLVNSARGVAAELREKGESTIDLASGQYQLPTAKEVWIDGKRYINGQEAL